jgi:hypothetical protein
MVQGKVMEAEEAVAGQALHEGDEARSGWARRRLEPKRLRRTIEILDAHP